MSFGLAAWGDGDGARGLRRARLALAEGVLLQKVIVGDDLPFLHRARTEVAVSKHGGLYGVVKNRYGRTCETAKAICGLHHSAEEAFAEHVDPVAWLAKYPQAEET